MDINGVLVEDPPEIQFGKELRLLFTGDRNWYDVDVVKAVIMKFKPALIIEGEAKGLDTIARDIAIELGIKVQPFTADWDIWGKAAGPLRNTRMIVEGKPDGIIAFHNNIKESKGTLNMIVQAIKHDLPVVLYEKQLDGNYKSRSYKPKKD